MRRAFKTLVFSFKKVFQFLFHREEKKLVSTLTERAIKQAFFDILKKNSRPKKLKDLEKLKGFFQKLKDFFQKLKFLPTPKF